MQPVFQATALQGQVPDSREGDSVLLLLRHRPGGSGASHGTAHTGLRGFL